jgi:hypothetical protein
MVSDRFVIIKIWDLIGSESDRYLTGPVSDKFGI